MSSSTSTELLAKLPASTQAFVQNAGSHLTGNAAFGANDADAKEIGTWFQSVATLDASQSSQLEALNVKLTSKTYLVGSTPSAADLALYSVLHPVFSTFTPAQYYVLPALTRYIDHIQNLPSVLAVRASTSGPDAVPAPITFDLEGAPKKERVVEVKEKKPKKEAAAASGSTPAPATPAAAPAAEGAAPAGKAGKKEKKAAAEGGATAAGGAPKEKKAKGGAAPAPAAAADAGEPSPSMIDLRVGKIIEVKRHPDADGLYVEQIDVGEAEPRTVVSGLVNYMPIEALQDRTIIVVANLKPASMRGIKSFAMVLCATHKDGKEHGIEFVEPPAGSKPGERVYFDDDKYRNDQPVPQLNPKKKVFETIQPGFTTLENLDAAWVDPASGTAYRIVTKDGPCRPKTFVGASLS
ncbi:nucleic acid-binding protein [Clavulina sp. PMI_390]|nr:nucleic acid-binding protein [Clavulina sp. PMI_390]